MDKETADILKYVDYITEINKILEKIDIYKLHKIYRKFLCDENDKIDIAVFKKTANKTEYKLLLQSYCILLGIRHSDLIFKKFSEKIDDDSVLQRNKWRLIDGGKKDI
jgi:hypothetical protein